MKLLLDENLPVKLKHRFLEVEIEAYTTKDMKWLGKENGELLQLMIENDFTCLVTIDNNISFQNNFKEYPISVLILIAHDNTYETLMDFFTLIVSNLKEEFTGSKVVVHPSFNK